MSSIVFRTLTLMSVLLCGVSTDEGVSLHCNQTVNVTSGDDLPLRCDIELKERNCEHVRVEWNKSEEDLCLNNACTTDNKTFASLQMSNVTENKTITVKIDADCGMDSKNITVKVNPGVHSTKADSVVGGPVFPTIIPILVAVVFAVIFVAAGVLYLYKRDKKPPVCLTEESGTLNSDSSHET